MKRQFLLVSLVSISLLLGMESVSATPKVSSAPIELQDIAGRKITLKQPAKRVILTQARYLPVLALLHPDPVSLLIGWSDEFKSSFANDYQAYVAKFPALEKIAIVGRHTSDSFSLERALGLRPDLVILTSTFAGLTPGSKPTDSPIIARFEAAGVPVVIVDFFIHPLENTEPSLRLLGKAIGREEQAEAFIRFYRKHMDRIASRNANSTMSAPPVFLHAHAGSTDCCNSPGLGTFNDMIRYAGGHNIGSDVLKTATGRLDLEYINSRNPQIYVATGTGAIQRRNSGGLVIGSQVTAEQSSQSLAKLLRDQGLTALPAVRSGHAYGIWHAFNDSPLHVVFMEALALWINPERFHDLDPQETLDEINRRFLAVPMQGSFMTSLPGQP